jgi:uncharacterized membrane protein YhaH (DUF805 family)
MLFIFLVELIPMVFMFIGLFAIFFSAITQSARYSNGYDMYGSDMYGGDSAFAAVGPTPGSVTMFVIGILLMMVIGLGLTIPQIALTWRRLHDANLAGPLYFLNLIPYAGSVVMIVFGCLPPKAEGERFDFGAPTAQTPPQQPYPDPNVYYQQPQQYPGQPYPGQQYPGQAYPGQQYPEQQDQGQYQPGQQSGQASPADPNGGGEDSEQTYPEAENGSGDTQ